jgi:hypothetical protein
MQSVLTPVIVAAELADACSESFALGMLIPRCRVRVGISLRQLPSQDEVV